MTPLERREFLGTCTGVLGAAMLVEGQSAYAEDQPTQAAPADRKRFVSGREDGRFVDTAGNPVPDAAVVWLCSPEPVSVPKAVFPHFETLAGSGNNSGLKSWPTSRRSSVILSWCRGGTTIGIRWRRRKRPMLVMTLWYS